MLPHRYTLSGDLCNWCHPELFIVVLMLHCLQPCIARQCNLRKRDDMQLRKRTVFRFYIDMGLSETSDNDVLGDYWFAVSLFLPVTLPRCNVAASPWP